MITNWCMLLGLLIFVNVGVKFSSSMPMAYAKEKNDVLYATQSGAIFTDLNQQNGDQNGDEYVEEEVTEYVPVQKKKSSDDTIKNIAHRLGRFFSKEPNHQASADPFNGVDTNNSNIWSEPILFKKNLLDATQALSQKVDSFYSDNDQDYGNALNQMFGDEANLSSEGKAPATSSKNAPSFGLPGGEDYADYLKKLLNEEEIPVEEALKENTNILPKVKNAMNRVPSAVSNYVSNLGKKTPPTATVVDQEQPGYGDDLIDLFAEADNPVAPSKSGLLPESMKKVPATVKTWMPNFGKQNNKGGADGQNLLNLSPGYDPNVQTDTKGPGQTEKPLDPWEQFLNEIKKASEPAASKPKEEKPPNDKSVPAAEDPNTHFPFNNPLFQRKPPQQTPSPEQPTESSPEKNNPKKPNINPDDVFQPTNAPSKANQPTTAEPVKPANEPPPASTPSAKKPPIDPEKIFEPQPPAQPKGTTPSSPTQKSPSKREPPPANNNDPFGVDPFAGLVADSPQNSPIKPSPSTPTKPENGPSQSAAKPISPSGQSPKPKGQLSPKTDPNDPNSIFEAPKSPPGPTKAGSSPSSPKSENPAQQPEKAPPAAKAPFPKLPFELVPSRSKPSQSDPPVGPTQEPPASKTTTPKSSSNPTGKPVINPDDIIVPANKPTQSSKPPTSELPSAVRPQLSKSASMPPLRTPEEEPQPNAPASSKPRAPERQTSQPPAAPKPPPTSPVRPQRMADKPLKPFSDEDEEFNLPIEELPPALQKINRPPSRSNVPDPKRLLQPSQSTKQQPASTDTVSKTPLRLKPNSSKLPQDIDINDDEMVELNLSRYGGTPQEKPGWWERNFGIKWVPLGEVISPGLLDQTKRASSAVGMPGIAGIVPGARVAGMGANAIQKITGLPQVYENPSDSGRWGRYVAGALSLAGFGFG